MRQKQLPKKGSLNGRRIIILILVILLLPIALFAAWWYDIPRFTEAYIHCGFKLPAIVVSSAITTPNDKNYRPSVLDDSYICINK